jgi:hypothetical protein
MGSLNKQISWELGPAEYTGRNDQAGVWSIATRFAGDVTTHAGWCGYRGVLRRYAPRASGIEHRGQNPQELDR